jgi:hypothetical protein
MLGANRRELELPFDLTTFVASTTRRCLGLGGAAGVVGAQDLPKKTQSVTRGEKMWSNQPVRVVSAWAMTSSVRTVKMT